MYRRELLSGTIRNKTLRLERQRRFNNDDGERSDTINALQMVHDAFYYMGFMQIAKYAVFLLMGIILMLYHVSTLSGAPNTAYFRMSITNMLASKPFPDGPSWEDVNTFYDTASYYKDTLTRLVNASEDAGAPENMVKIGEYGRVIYARVVANFEENCELAKKRVGFDCWHHATATINGENKTVEDIFQLGPPSGGINGTNYDLWHTTYSRYFTFRSASATDKNWQALVLITVDPEEDRNAFLRKINEQLSDTHLQLLGRYTYLLGLDIIAQNAASKNVSDDYAIFSLRMQRSSRGKGDVDNKAVHKISVTTPGRRELNASKHDRGRKVVEVIFWFIYFWVLMMDVVQLKIARQQGTSLLSFFTHFWNLYNWAVNLALAAWLITYFILWYAWNEFYHMKPWPLVPYTCHHFFRYEVYSTYYARWVYAGIGLILFVGLRMVQFSRLHPGVNVFHVILAKTLRDLMDFLVVFAFILCLFGTCVFLLFQINGGNMNWITWSDGASVLSRLAFQQAGYEDIYNSGIGSGANGYAITAIFWMCIAVLFVFSGNIFLSAVSYAYGSVRDMQPQVETFFLVEIFYRIIFGICFIFWITFGYRSHKKGKEISYLLTTRRTTTQTHTTRPPPNAPTQRSTSRLLPVDLEAGLSGKHAGSDTTTDVHTTHDLHPSPDTIMHTIDEGSDTNVGTGRAFRASSSGSSSDEIAQRDQHAVTFTGTDESKGKGTGTVTDAAPHVGKRAFEVATQGEEKSGKDGSQPRCGSIAALFDVLFHEPDVNFFRLFLPENLTKYPRLYMLSRWAVASRPEVRALATYFIDFRKFSLATTTKKRNKFTSQNPLLLPRLRHLPIIRGDDCPEIDWDKIDLEKLTLLLEQAKSSHSKLMDAASLFVVPSFITKLFLGHFWLDYHKRLIPHIANKVYDASYMQQIESSFAIDEDEDMALPTISDLRHEVDTMKGQLQATLQAELAKVTSALVQAQAQLAQVPQKTEV